MHGLAGYDAPAEASANAVAFRQMFAAIIAVEGWDTVARHTGDPAALSYIVLAALATLGAALAASARWCQLGLVLLAACVGAHVIYAFPSTANHHYVELFCLALLLLLRPGVAAEAQRLTSSLRWVLLIALFYAGVQKLAWGYYFQGEFLTFAVSQSPRFAAVFEPLIPSAEFARVTSLAVAEGAGPYRIASPLFLLVSNVAYLAELVLPPMLLVRAARRPAVVLVILYFAAIEAAAREVFFGGIMVLLVLLFWPGDALRRVRPLYAIALLYLLAMIFGLLPRWEFT